RVADGTRLHDQFERRRRALLKPADLGLTLRRVDVLPVGLTAGIFHEIHLPVPTWSYRPTSTTSQRSCRAVRACSSASRAVARMHNHRDIVRSGTGSSIDKPYGCTSPAHLTNSYPRGYESINNPEVIDPRC